MTCGVLEFWQTARGDYNRRELHETWCGAPAVATIPAGRSLDGEPVDVCLIHNGAGNFSIETAPGDHKFCRYCTEWDDTAYGHGLGECVAEHEPEHPDI